MKKFLIGLMVLLVATCSLGCIRSSGRYKTTMCISNQTKSAFSMEYESLDGNKKYGFSVPEDTTLNVKFVTKKGTLSCVVTDKAGKEYYRNEDVQTEELTIKLDKKGDYTAVFRATGHEGGFSFSW